MLTSKPPNWVVVPWSIPRKIKSLNLQSHNSITFQEHRQATMFSSSIHRRDNIFSSTVVLTISMCGTKITKQIKRVPSGGRKQGLRRQEKIEKLYGKNQSRKKRKLKWQHNSLKTCCRASAWCLKFPFISRSFCLRRHILTTCYCINLLLDGLRRFHWHGVNTEAEKFPFNHLFLHCWQAGIRA